MIDRRKARVLAMQALCQLEVLGDEWLAQLDEFVADEGDESGVQQYAKGLITGVWTELAAVDQLLQSVSQHWDVKRMSTVDRNILRVGVRELMNVDGAVPPHVTINEAIELGKLYGSAESASFINGLLDGVHKALESASESKPETLTTDQ